MPQYSFQERFVPFVLDGSKPHTIRTRRRHPAKIGDPLYLFFGLRTKFCKRLRNEVCSNTHSLAICSKWGIVFYDRLLTDEEILIATENPLNRQLFKNVHWKSLSDQECNELAWKDGFRPDAGKQEAFKLMLRFWQQTHSLPWVGDIIYWNPQK